MGKADPKRARRKRFRASDSAKSRAAFGPGRTMRRRKASERRKCTVTPPFGVVREKIPVRKGYSRTAGASKARFTDGMRLRVDPTETSIAKGVPRRKKRRKSGGMATRAFGSGLRKRRLGKRGGNKAAPRLDKTSSALGCGKRELSAERRKASSGGESRGNRLPSGREAVGRRLRQRGTSRRGSPRAKGKSAPFGARPMRRGR